MAIDDLKSLPIGSVIRHVTGNAYDVVGHTSNGWPIVRREITATNPPEWDLVQIGEDRRHAEDCQCGECWQQRER